MISTSLSFVCDILLFLFFSRHRIPVPRPDVRRLACLSLPLLAYASYRLFFGYTLVSSSGWSNAAIFLSEISIAFLLNTLLLREGRRFALMQAVLFGLSLQVGRKTSFHVVLPFLDPFFASVPHPFLLSLVSFVSLNALKLLFVLPLVTPAQTEAENDIRPLQLLPLLFAVHITLVVDVFLAASGPVHLTLVCYLSAFVCTLLSNLMLKKDRQLADMAKIQDNMRLSYALALQKEESDEQIRRMVHDLRHQLTALEAGEHREEALKELRDSLEQARPVSYSDHPVLNAVLTEACQKADAAGVTFRVESRFGTFPMLSDLEVSSLFSNACSNALDAARESEEKWIEGRYNETETFMVVIFRNSFAHLRRAPDGTFLTTKEGGLHGIGLKSMKETVSRHGGSLKASCEDRVFTLTLYLPKASSTQNHI